MFMAKKTHPEQMLRFSKTHEDAKYKLSQQVPKYSHGLTLNLGSK